LADQDFLSGKPHVPTVKETRNEEIAIVGSGPAGLTAAYFLARDGYQVTVFEKMPIAGGMMAVGIPEYRLPRDVTARDIKVIQDMGVEIKTGVTFGEDMTLQNLKQDGYKAVFLAMGLQQNRRLNIDGEDMKGVLKGVDFLRDVALENPVSIGKRVVVIGGGNVAIDVALTSLRKGAQEVSLVCLEQRNEMPAWEHEIIEALEVGVKIIHGFGPNKFIERGGKLFGVEFKRCIDVCDSSGAFNPKYDEIDLTRLEAETVIVAIGQAADLSFAKKQEIVLSPEGYLMADPVTLQTPIEGVFAGGDAYYGPRTIVEAIGSGKEAAISIDRYIQGLSLTADRDLPWNSITKPHIDRYDPASRTQMPRLKPEVWVKDFAEVQLGFTEEMVLKEAKRCISCGACCIQACPYHAISFDAKSGKTEKCNLCYNRVIHGLYPACADNICLAHCIYFGDPVEIEKKIQEKRNIRGGWGEIIPKDLINSRQ
jgi:NADPH-dependent glutamate synthase beta subunit-like oxidoreductase